MSPTTAVVDIDGTLIDSNYHHALAWSRAFSDVDRSVPLWRIHRAIGMGGDQLVAAVTDEYFAAQHGAAARDRHARHYAELVGEVRVLPGAREFLIGLADAGAAVVLASSAQEEEVQHAVELLDAATVVNGWTTAADVDRTKPDPQLIQRALTIAGCDPAAAVLIGDSSWDMDAGRAAGVALIGVLSGGFSAGELLDHGAEAVFPSVAEIEIEDGPGGLTMPCLRAGASG